MSTTLNNPPTQLSISTTLTLRLEMSSQQKSDPSISNLTRTDDQLKGNWMGGECGMHGEEKKFMQGFGKKRGMEEFIWKT